MGTGPMSASVWISGRPQLRVLPSRPQGFRYSIGDRSNVSVGVRREKGVKLGRLEHLAYAREKLEIGQTFQISPSLSVTDI